MRTQQTHQLIERLPILEKMELLVGSTEHLLSLLNASEKGAIISSLEKDTILKQFATKEAQLAAFYLLLNSKQCPTPKLLSLFNSTGNQNIASVFEEKEEDGDENVSSEEREKWYKLQKLIADNIDRLSTHTMNLGLVLCFASGVGLISGKDREIIANCSTLEIDQLKKFYVTVSLKKADAYEKLLKILKMTNNNWTLDVLQIKD